MSIFSAFSGYILYEIENLYFTKWTLFIKIISESLLYEIMLPTYDAECQRIYILRNGQNSAVLIQNINFTK